MSARRRDQQNDDLAHLLDRAEHVAGLAADLRRLNRATATRRRQHDHGDQRARKAEANSTNHNAERRAGDAARAAAARR